MDEHLKEVENDEKLSKMAEEPEHEWVGEP